MVKGSGDPRICVIGATFTTGNLGVNALAAGIVKCILHSLPNAAVFFLDYGKSGRTESARLRDRVVQIDVVNMRFSKTICWNNIAVLMLLALTLKVIPSGKLKRAVVRRNVCLRRISEAGLVASITGGDSFSDIYGMQRFLYAALPQLLVLLMTKRLVLLPQTIGPFKGWLARRTAGFIMRRADLVYSRDLASREAAQVVAGVTNPEKFRFCYDLGFLLDPIPSTSLDIRGLPPKKIRLRVGLNVSGLLYVGGYTRNNMFGLQVRYEELVDRLIGALIQQGAEVLLVPHVLGADLESDQIACSGIYHRLCETYTGSIGCVAGDYDQSEIKAVIGDCDFFVGSRMHACIAALSQGVPTVAIAYSDKFAGVLQSIGVPADVFDARKMSVEEIVRGVLRNFGARENQRRVLLERMPEVTRTALTLFEDVLSLRHVPRAVGPSYCGPEPTVISEP
jgi:polysaccharide pyruvyl transferase WcaK-like protein